MTLSRRSAAAPNYAALKERQQATSASGDCAVIGTTLQIVGERLREAVDSSSTDVVDEQFRDWSKRCGFSE